MRRSKAHRRGMRSRNLFVESLERRQLLSADSIGDFEFYGPVYLADFDFGAQSFVLGQSGTDYDTELGALRDAGVIQTGQPQTIAPVRDLKSIRIGGDRLTPPLDRVGSPREIIGFLPSNSHNDEMSVDLVLVVFRATNDVSNVFLIENVVPLFASSSASNSEPESNATPGAAEDAGSNSNAPGVADFQSPMSIDATARMSAELVDASFSDAEQNANSTDDLSKSLSFDSAMELSFVSSTSESHNPWGTSPSPSVPALSDVLSAQPISTVGSAAKILLEESSQLYENLSSLEQTLDDLATSQATEGSRIIPDRPAKHRTDSTIARRTLSIDVASEMILLSAVDGQSPIHSVRAISEPTSVWGVGVGLFRALEIAGFDPLKELTFSQVNPQALGDRIPVAESAESGEAATVDDPVSASSFVSVAAVSIGIAAWRKSRQRMPLQLTGTRGHGSKSTRTRPSA